MSEKRLVGSVHWHSTRQRWVYVGPGPDGKKIWRYFADEKEAREFRVQMNAVPNATEEAIMAADRKHWQWVLVGGQAHVRQPRAEETACGRPIVGDPPPAYGREEQCPICWQRAVNQNVEVPGPQPEPAEPEPDLSAFIVEPIPARQIRFEREPEPVMPRSSGEAASSFKALRNSWKLVSNQMRERQRDILRAQRELSDLEERRIEIEHQMDEVYARRLERRTIKIEVQYKQIKPKVEVTDE